MSVCNPYLVSCPFELTTSGEINMWGKLPLDIRKKILQDVDSSYTMEMTSKVEVPYDLLPDDQRDAMKLQMKLQIPVKLKMNFVKKMRVDLTTDFEITFSQTLNEEPIAYDESLKHICKRLQIDKQVLYTRIQDIKTWSRISKIKVVKIQHSRKKTLHFIHKTTNSIDPVPGFWNIHLNAMLKFFGEALVIDRNNPNDLFTKKETRNEQINWKKRKKLPVYH